MEKLEKVIKAWECCNPFNRRCFECPYDADCFHDSFDRVAIADMVKLLKEQQEKIDGLLEDLATAIDDKDSALLTLNECDTVEHALFVLRKHGWKETDDVPYPVELLKEKQPKHGHWIEQEGFDGDVYYDCSVCGESWVTVEGTPEDNGMFYCPHCGAKMDEPKDGDGE